MAHGIQDLSTSTFDEVVKAADTPDPAVLGPIRDLMRAVVLEGTATQLGSFGEVYGKTGTAEFTGDGRSHAWFIGYRGDLAFAVLIVDGGRSSNAVQVAARFLTAVG